MSRVTKFSDRESRNRSRVPAREKLIPLAEFLEMTGVARSTYNDWHAKGRAPRRIKLPNGQICFRPSELNRWLELLEQEPGKAA
ncbi:MAG: helix-turn-helix transcriptional regulator [Actinopolymorphaceae bacterium]